MQNLLSLAFSCVEPDFISSSLYFLIALSLHGVRRRWHRYVFRHAHYHDFNFDNSSFIELNDLKIFSQNIKMFGFSHIWFPETVYLLWLRLWLTSWSFFLRTSYKSCAHCLKKTCIWYTMWGKKTAPFYFIFCNSRTLSSTIIFGTHTLQEIFYHPYIPYCIYNQRQRTSLSLKSTAGQLAVHPQPSCSFVARRRTLIIAPNLWLPNIPYFST